MRVGEEFLAGQDQNLVGREVLVPAFELLRVPAPRKVRVVPVRVMFGAVRPKAGVGAAEPLLLGFQRLFEVELFQTERRVVVVVGEGPRYWVPQHCYQLHLRQRSCHPLWYRRMKEVVGGGFARDSLAYRKAGPVVRKGAIAVLIEVVDLFVAGRRDLRMLGEIVEERGRTPLLRADDQERGKRSKEDGGVAGSTRDAWPKQVAPHLSLCGHDGRHHSLGTSVRTSFGAMVPHMSTRETVTRTDESGAAPLRPRADREGGSRLSILQSVRRRPFLSVLPPILLVLVAAGYSFQRVPVYTAEARMSVGGIDLSQPGALNGYATATQALATAYSRAIGAQEVVRSVSKDTDLTPVAVRSRLDATPVPQSPIFRILATGDNANQAIAVANSASKALRTYVSDSSSTSAAQGDSLLRAFRIEQLAAARASQKLATAKQRLEASPTAKNRAAVARAQADSSAAQLRANVASQAYTKSVGATSVNQSVTILSPATFALNDRRSKIQIYAFIALLVGAVLGAALATLAEDRRYRRSLTRS